MISQARIIGCKRDRVHPPHCVDRGIEILQYVAVGRTDLQQVTAGRDQEPADAPRRPTCRGRLGEPSCRAAGRGHDVDRPRCLVGPHEHDPFAVGRPSWKAVPAVRRQPPQRLSVHVHRDDPDAGARKSDPRAIGREGGSDRRILPLRHSLEAGARRPNPEQLIDVLSGRHRGEHNPLRGSSCTGRRGDVPERDREPGRHDQQHRPQLATRHHGSLSGGLSITGRDRRRRPR